MAKWKCEICGNKFDNFHAQGFDNKIYCPLCYLKKENQELKKQLEEKTKIGISDHKYASKCEDKVITIENQQKEFIKYLENKRDEYAENLEYWSSELINIILSKYKSVIGVSDEKEN